MENSFEVINKKKKSTLKRVLICYRFEEEIRKLIIWYLKAIAFLWLNYLSKWRNQLVEGCDSVPYLLLSHLIHNTKKKKKKNWILWLIWKEKRSRVQFVHPIRHFDSISIQKFRYLAVHTFIGGWPEVGWTLAFLHTPPPVAAVLAH